MELSFISVILSFAEEDSKPPTTPPVLPAVRNMKDLFEIQGQSTVVPRLVSWLNDFAKLG